MDKQAVRLLELIRACYRRARVARSDLALELDHVLTNTDQPQLGVPLSVSENVAARSHLAAAIEVAKAGVASEIAYALDGVGFRLPWRYSYPEPNPVLSANVAFAELMGPSAHFLNDDIRLGFTLIGPNVFYPLHVHPAVELYYLVSGGSKWTAGTQVSDVVPGEFVFHPSNMPHATQAQKQSTLAIYSWRTNIEAPSRYI